MSLINDALKRARQAQTNNLPPPPNLQFRPADPAPQPSSGPPKGLIAAVVVVFALIGLVVAVALQKGQAVQPVVNAREPSSPVIQTTTASAEAPAANSLPVAAPAPQIAEINPTPSVASLTGLAQVPEATNAADSSASAVETTNPATAVADVTPPKPAVPKLQGIFYRPARPSAVINGKNVFIGDRVGEYQVSSITRETVTVGSAIQTNILTLGE